MRNGIVVCNLLTFNYLKQSYSKVLNFMACFFILSVAKVVKKNRRLVKVKRLKNWRAAQQDINAIIRKTSPYYATY